jgi:tellurite resistance protein
LEKTMPTDEQAAYASAAWQRFDKEIEDELARAVLSAFALVAVVDGDLAESEIDGFFALMQERHESLADLGVEQYEHVFRDICGAIMSHPEAGTDKALANIAAVGELPEQVELVLTAAEIALQADEREQASEAEALTLIRQVLGQD